MATPCAERAYATLAPYYDAFTRHHRHDLWLERLERLARWEGHGCGAAPGEPGSAEISIFERAGSAWRRHASRHDQRWWSAEDVERACAAGGLTLDAVRGQLPGARLQADADESAHTKVVYLARRGWPHDREGGSA
jgi:hypothetical protein